MLDSPTEAALSFDQLETVRLLNRLFGRVFGDRYADFCILASGRADLHTSIPLAAHSMREFESMLRGTLVGPLEAEPPHTAGNDQKLELAEGTLRALGFGDEATERALKALGPRRDHASEIKAVARRLGFDADSSVTKSWVALSRMAGGAHKRSFHEDLMVDEAFREKFQQPFDLVVRSIALALEARYGTFLLRVNELAEMTDAGKALKLFESEIPGAPTLQWHFFQIIETPRWLRPLLRSRFAREPKLRLPDSNQGMRSRQWPIGAYLRRMAAAEEPNARKLVAEAIRLVAASHNPDVRDQGAEIIAALPVAEAAELIDVLAGWVSQGLNHGYMETPVRLLKTFAEGGQRNGAFRLARAIFGLVNESGTVSTLHSEHMYEHYLPQAVGALGGIDSAAAVEVFSDLLLEAAQIGGKLRDGDWTEYTPHPLSDSQMANYSVYDALVLAVRDAACLDQAPDQIEKVISYMFDRGPRIFDRIGLQVLSQFAEHAPALAARCLADVKFIGQSWCEDEYAELAKAWFFRLSQSQQDVIFDIIDALPEQYPWWSRRFEEHHGKPPNADDIRVFRLSVVRDAVWKWRDVLPKTRREDLDTIIQSIGDPDVWRNTISRPSVSPVSVEDLLSRSIPEIVNFVHSWQPQTEPVRQTVGALGQQLRSAAERHPAKFIDGAAGLVDLRPIYTRRILEGLSTAARNQNGLVWRSALILIESTVSRLNERVELGELVDDDDKDWQWAVIAAVDLLKAILRLKVDGLANEDAPRIVTIIEALSRLAPKASVSENFEEEFRKHPTFAAEQTLRGSVSDLCVLFLYWATQGERAPLGSAPRAAIAVC